MTPTTVRMVLVEGEKADGLIVDHDAFEITADGSATSLSAAEQVVEAVLGTKESAAEGGHHLKSIGVTWSDHAEASTLRDALAARGIDDVMLVSDGHAAGALAQAAGRAIGYATTALLFIDRDTATLSVVQTDDGSVVKVLSRSLHSNDAMAVLTEMAAAVDAQDSAPQRMFVVGSGVDVTSVKAHLENLVGIPVSAPDQPELALARGAALASANAPAFEATTVGLAYSQDPDGTTAGAVYPGLAAAETQLAPVGADALVDDYTPKTDMEPIAEEGRKPFLLVGSALTSIFVVGVVALVISLAVSIRPTVDQRPNPGPNAIVPSTLAPEPTPEPAPVQEAQQPVAPPPPAQTIKAPVPVAVQEAPAPRQAPRQVFVEQAPAPQAPPPAPAPAAPPPAPVAPPPAPIPVAPAPVPYVPPVFSPPVYNPYLPPPAYYPRPRNPWNPPWSPPKTWTPKPPSYPWPQEPDESQQPPQQWPYPGSGGSGPGGSGGGYGPGGSGGSGGPGGSSGSNGGGSGVCFLMFCSGGPGR